jgi:3-deoxy-D-arabino-heptulosonate 7-phosphate (DAHP) synthase class II
VQSCVGDVRMCLARVCFTRACRRRLAVLSKMVACVEYGWGCDVVWVGRGAGQGVHPRLQHNEGVAATPQTQRLPQ